MDPSGRAREADDPTETNWVSNVTHEKNQETHKHQAERRKQQEEAHEKRVQEQKQQDEQNENPKPKESKPTESKDKGDAPMKIAETISDVKNTVDDITIMASGNILKAIIKILGKPLETGRKQEQLLIHERYARQNAPWKRVLALEDEIIKLEEDLNNTTDEDKRSEIERDIAAKQKEKNTIIRKQAEERKKEIQE